MNALQTIDAKTQHGRLLAMLDRGKVTTIDIHNAYILAAAGAVLKLRRAGFNIVTTRLKNGVAEYSLIRPTA